MILRTFPLLALVLVPAAVVGGAGTGAATTSLQLDTDCRIGGKVVEGRGCLYAVGGGNVSGESQISRLTLGKDGLPSDRKPAGEICKGDCGACSAAISGRWLFVTGGSLKGVTVRFEIQHDGTLANRTEIPDGDRPCVNVGGMVASGKYLIVVGGWNTRLCYMAEVRPDGSLGPWVKGNPLPQICFCRGRVFRLGNRLCAAGNQNYESPSDRVFSAVVDESGSAMRWRRWAALPERAAHFDFHPMPDGKSVLYVNEETGALYVAPVAEDGRFGAWSKLENALSGGPYASQVGLPLPCGKYLRVAACAVNPRRFLPVDAVEMK